MKKKLFYSLLFLLPALSCREKFVANINSPQTGYLVVEGIINSGGGSTNIFLSRTSKSTGSDILYENGANVSVEGSDNSIKSLQERPNGLYNADQLDLNNSVQYRLRITTSDGKEYLSDF